MKEEQGGVYELQIHQDGVHDSRAVEDAIRDRVNQNPTDEVGQRRDRLYEFLEWPRFYLVEKNREYHGKPGEKEAQAAYCERVPYYLKELYYLDLVPDH